MKFFSLILKSARRSRRRTALTILSVALAVFLFASLRAVLDGFNACDRRLAPRRASSTIRSTSLIFSMPTSHVERDSEHAWRPGPDLGELVRRHLQGSPEFLRAVRRRARKLPAHVPEFHPHAGARNRRSSRIEPGALSATGSRAGSDGTWAIGLFCRSGFPPTAPRTTTFTIRGIYQRGGSAVDNQSMLFHWKYADERSIEKGRSAGMSCRSTPDHAPQIAQAIDQKFANTPYETKTDTEKQFSGLVCHDVRQPQSAARQHRFCRRHHDPVRGANTMAMSVRERTTEIAVMRTLGFPLGAIFFFIAGEGLLISLVGGVLGAGLAWFIADGEKLGISGGFAPVFGGQPRERGTRHRHQRDHRFDRRN